MNETTYQNNQVKNEVETKLANIEKLLEEIKESSNKSLKGNVNWSNIGSLAYVENQLQEIAQFIE